MDNTQHRVFPRNPKNIIESDDDNEAEVTEATNKKANLSKPTLSQEKKTNDKPVPKSNRQPSVEDGNCTLCLPEVDLLR